MTTDNRPGGPAVHIDASALVEAEKRAVQGCPREVGGILVGWWEDGTAVVHELLHVPDRKAGLAHYERRHSPAQQVLHDHLRAHNYPRCGYIGEWHTHPAPQPPSPNDRASLSGIVRQVRGPVALVVLAVTAEREVASHALIGTPRWPRRTRITAAPIERVKP